MTETNQPAGPPADDPRPAILLVAQPGQREAMAREFRHRYDHDYAIHLCDSVSGALATVRALEAAGAQLALVGATPELVDGDALGLFAEVHVVVPTARRLCLLPEGGYAGHVGPLRAALSDGRLDTWLGIPQGPRDEEFHSAVSEMLSEWNWSSHSVGVDGVQVVTDEKSPDLSRIVDFLQRMGIPHRRYSTEDETGARIRAEAGPNAQLPLLRSLTGELLSRPSNADLGALMYGRVSDLPEDLVADLLVVGSGPAGLAAAVYGASEGLSTVVLESEAVGGQAGTSSMIRNYLGFPRGISGMRLAQRARMQATRFGARFFVGTPVAALAPGAEREPHCVLLEDGSRVRSRTVLIASGASYRRLDVDGVESLAGRGVHYGAATSVARDTTDRVVHVVGGGNSAGQAAVHLARFAREVTMVVRRGDLTATMSDYLVREVLATARITVRPNTAVTDGGGEGRLQWLALTDVRTDETERVQTDALMLLLGAEPCAAWLLGSSTGVDLDADGFVLTGREVPPGRWGGELPPPPLATSLPGVFAAGDVRSGSLKRVASASGEGAAVVPLVHAYLSDL